MEEKQEMVDRAFIESTTSGHSGEARVVNRGRICRVTINIEALKHIKNRKSTKHVVLKITVEGKSRKILQTKGEGDDQGVVPINQSFAFDITDLKRSTLVVHLYKHGFFGKNPLGQSKQILVSDLLKDEEGLMSRKSEWYDLYSKDKSKVLPGKILMQIGAGVAQPEQKIHLFVGTWNVGNAQPADNLSNWLPASSAYDLVAIGAQECDYTPRVPYTDCAKDWVAHLKSTLGSDYKLVHGLSRGQMRLVIFVHINSQKAISEVLNGSEATGVGHVVSNKGGICISLKFWDTSLCFVNCHFAAHEGQCELRNQNYREIVGNIRVQNTNTDILNQFHHVFWLGDLNYRLSDCTTKDKLSTSNTGRWDVISEHIRQKEFDQLLKMDELYQERQAKRVLYAFMEGKLTFPPTFKMKRDSEDAYQQKRLPAWCDRVLWSSLPGCHVEQLSYTSTPSITTSDHKPVAATFSLTAYALPCDSKEDLDEDNMRWHVRFTALRGKNLRVSDFSGYSDPYVKFFGPNLFQEVKSKVKFQDLNPVWDPLKDVPVIVLNTSAIERLEKEYIFVRIIDFDYTSRDDTLGYGVIPLRGAVSALKGNGNYDFEVEISYHGCPAGTLEGTMQLTWERNITKRRLNLSKSLIVRSRTLRHQLKRRVLSRHIFSEKMS
ncbi:hypothetical protein KP509_36G055300 [Ceratopteris richardii]|uniref:C2 domain-containing protein n=1 Tax=Ceratopteris richardii TaxID=49495 RepID=A0A8T2QD58_CERRI|nr:hypothetical protein KP509_36G055300 [Ceratopteris richardii]KAH7281612.1 hypothetical protein KP509_36G055300 [Ceratopteris richardii]KAH7281614.1 hypothetical protein KP509_36G055300 [Ceratopteris richardii]KAH7281616.1 hypothetical protein KP509_36G055300 [Ceratopteris richardii]